ncbi:zinc-dependent alcohol dehydrogenase [Pseudonocardia alaniniphila]|uniref:Alcohol dehydrogenase catalytic domain-containing protein n=1 Tax=Pseudonocardia alaniniphila TaxID=75291 RepID=A0ABS9TSY4_9PSEU|nr:alcohol dehydrogenase catalytic domain-containing protein [Pseudonocardia alaniniphila]MCH6171366.1 alcohol dehydrogenase catalytic domain-containing protein [Pseudonocardia alaniniphila]
MRSARWQGIGSIGLIEEQAPVPGPLDVVLDVGACGICGSDVHAFAEGAWIAEGSAMGHEFAGTVSAAGAGIRDLAVGHRVAVNPMGPCGTCAQCAAGRTNLCADPHRSARGGLGDQVLVPHAEMDGRLFRMPEGMSFEEGAFLEPLSVAVRAVRSAAPDLDAPIVVAGLGSIGQCVLRVLQAAGARDMLGIDVSPARLKVAAATGAAVLDSRSADAHEHILDRWGTSNSPYQPGSGNVRTFFECSGALPVLALATAVTRAGGTVAVAGLTSTTPPVDVNTIVQKELRLLGSFAYTPVDSTEAFRLLSEGHVQVAPLVSHRVPLSRVAEAFATQHAVDGSVKVVVVPD